MTIPELQTRIAQHKAAREQYVANINALDGAIQEAQHWLDVALAKEPKTLDDALRESRNLPTKMELIHEEMKSRSARKEAADFVKANSTHQVGGMWSPEPPTAVHDSEV